MCKPRQATQCPQGWPLPSSSVIYVKVFLKCGPHLQLAQQPQEHEQVPLPLQPQEQQQEQQEPLQQQQRQQQQQKQQP